MYIQNMYNIQCHNMRHIYVSMQVHTGDMIHVSHAFLLLVYWYHHIRGLCAPYGINYHWYGFLSFGVVLNKYAFGNG